jgi:L-ribulose-5-phosphate 4-epimerase
MDSLKLLQQEVCAANLALVTHKLVISSFGNVSGIDRKKGIIAIKPSGVSYSTLTPEQIVLVDLNNKVVSGNLRPSSDTKTHIELYKAFPEIGGVVHTHSPHATAWAQAKKAIPCLGTTHADHCPGDIPCTAVMSDQAIRGDYETETGLQIIETFKNLPYQFTPMVLVASHGPFTWGKTPQEAVENAVILEYLAEMALNTLKINPEIKPVKKSLVNKHFERKHGKTAYYGQK